MELRDIEIFLTLCEELHFGRTAARLHLTQARVSQSIKQQERRIGGPLFERTSRNVRLTALGEQLRDDLQPSFHALRRGVRRAQETARGITGRLRVGMINYNAHELRLFGDAFRTLHPQWDVRVRHNHFIEPFEPLRAGQVDVLVTWLPVEEPDLTAGPVIFTEPNLLIVASDHPLTRRATVSLEDLGDFPVTDPIKPVPDVWENAYQPFETPRGRPIPRGVSVTTWEDTMTYVAAGELVSFSGAHAARFSARPDVVYLPLAEEPTLNWGLVWRTDAEDDLIRAFVQVVRDLGPAEL
jgi:DNA-binding transcriptional LysR family regulator